MSERIAITFNTKEEAMAFIKRHNVTGKNLRIVKASNTNRHHPGLATWVIERD